MHPLSTKLPELSPLMGLLRIDQLAFLARNDHDEAMIKRMLRLDKAEWVEDQLSGDYALNKLASYLDRGDLSLRSARQVFRETFLGA